MTKPSVRLSLGRYLILLAGIQFFFSGCAQLDGVFPKFKPKKITKKSTSTSSAEIVTEQQANTGADETVFSWTLWNALSN